jgi:hypothetical protein
MFTLAYILARDKMRRRMIGALATDPVLPSPDDVEKRRREPVDRRRPVQRRPHVAFVSPQAAGCDKDLA